MRISLIIFAAAFILTACEGSVEGPNSELSLQTRDALEILPANVDMAGMANLQAARQSALFEGHESPFSTRNMYGEGAARFDEFMRRTGFNPDEDIRRVYMTASERTDGQSRPAFVVYADFNRARVDAYLDDNSATDVARSTYNDTPVYLFAEDDGTFGLGLINDEMAVAGEQSELYAMIDRIANGTPGLSGDAQMMALIARASHPDGAWFAVRKFDDRDSASDHDGPMAGMSHAFRLMGSGVMSFGFEGRDVEMTAVGIPRDNASVRDVADMLRGAVAVMRTTSEDGNPAMADMLDGVQIRETGDAVQVQAVLETAFLEGMHSERKN